MNLDPLHTFPPKLAPSELVEPLSVVVVVVLCIERGFQALVPVDVCVRCNEFVYLIATLLNLLVRVAYDFHRLVDLYHSLWMLCKVVVPKAVLEVL